MLFDKCDGVWVTDNMIGNPSGFQPDAGILVRVAPGAIVSRNFVFVGNANLNPDDSGISFSGTSPGLVVGPYNFIFGAFPTGASVGVRIAGVEEVGNLVLQGNQILGKQLLETGILATHPDTGVVIDGNDVSGCGRRESGPEIPAAPG